MFKILTIKDMVRVPPTKFGVDMDEAIRESLMEQVEGRIDPDVGVLLAITDIKGVSGVRYCLRMGRYFMKQRLTCCHTLLKSMRWCLAKSSMSLHSELLYVSGR